MDRLTAMEVLVRVVENGSFSGAARLLRFGTSATGSSLVDPAACR
jgi:DNA-binding transcriptional LysR family regulator